MNQELELVYREKYLKYKTKYLELKKKYNNKNLGEINIYIKDKFGDEITAKITPSMYEENIIPSFCDRILYKGNISVLNYGTILISNLCNSDHLLVFGVFENNNKIGVVITFNIDKYDGDEENSKYIQNALEKIIFKICSRHKKKINYVIFNYQESANEPWLSQIVNYEMVDKINDGIDSFAKCFVYPTYNNKNRKYISLPKYRTIQSSSSSWTNQDTRIIILYLEDNIKINEFDNIYFGNIGQYIAGSKAAVGYEFDGICFVGCHLPIDTSKKEQNTNYMGNNLRITALKKIVEKLQNYPNVIISGDMNFRIYKENNIEKEQLEELLKSTEGKFLNDYKEFGKLEIKSCKINSNVSCSLV